MNALNVFSYLNKSFSTKVRTVYSSCKNLQHDSLKPSKTSFYSRKPTDKDVVLFKYENPKLFVIINLASGLTCAFWTYLGLFLFQSLKKADIDENPKQLWRKILQKERKYSDVLCAISLIFGWAMLSATIFYSLRSVRRVILNKGGRNLTIVTYNLPGRNTIKVPLGNVSSSEHRTKAKKYIPLKIKDKFFYYLLDVRGEFAHPELFDSTAGISRNF